MSERFIESSEFARSLPEPDTFGGRSSRDAAREAVRRHYGDSDIATAAIGYLSGQSLVDVANMMETTEDRAYELILAAEQRLLRLRSKRQGRQTLRVVGQPQRTVEQPATYSSEESEGWRNQGACKDEDPELFFPQGARSAVAVRQLKAAKAVCARCDVQTVCLEWALDHGQESGVWRGMSEDERRQLKRDAR